MKSIRYRKKFLILILLFLLCIPQAIKADPKNPRVFTVKIENMVTAGTAQHVIRAIDEAEKEGAEALVIFINTPGGLVNATLDMIERMTNSRIPIITYVAPKGAIAASAGTFILISGDIAAMSPGTTCGAAMPVALSNPAEAPQAADQKTINFLAQHMRSIAEQKGRPGDVAEKFVTENLSLTYDRALEKGIIDLTADNLDDLLARINGYKVKTAEGEKSLQTADARIIPVEKTVKEKVTDLVSNPQIAVILIMIGIYGLITGFNSPGFFLPEVLGSICLLLGLYGLGLFEINIAAGIFILLGIGLLIAEAFTPTYGILGTGGVISLVLGIIFLPVEPMMPGEWFSGLKFVAVSIGVITALFVLLILTSLIKLRKKPPVEVEAEMKQEIGVVVRELNPEGMVKVYGEIWNARTENGENIPEGKKVKVVGRRGMQLIVSPAEKKDKEVEK
ncbi:membrane-bound serine protease (ClpP class) [Thermosyntropha lipolytica DSM 11003]|uniref:Membrane-bound serine protease (ClpP class) n=1 Tax=Thermosyntropha lipolytica DSM 11003 TaxID=1123382 RepID=A0A1M5JWN9_9FIRM|nr:nodulation protein NfeD [Thermosyntropha lipolytica]SHG44981.1 membrane-bound serine protease (ClpP class) [Thermosyntropha lipolytica DSM 11003]